MLDPSVKTLYQTEEERMGLRYPQIAHRVNIYLWYNDVENHTMNVVAGCN
jgi:hypothetical protein